METKDIWNIYADDVKYFILNRVKDRLVADDLLQETFIKVHTKLETLRNENKLKSWVFSIARYTVMDYFREQKREHKPFDEEFEEDCLFEDETLAHSEHDCLRGIIKSLPKKYRGPLFLSDIKGLKQAEIATQLRLPLSTVKSQIQRARKLIAQGFMDCCDFKINKDGFLAGEIKDKHDCKICN